MSPQRHRQKASSSSSSSSSLDDDTAGITGPSPERIIRFAFALIVLKATNDVFERHHGISPLDGVLKGLNEARKKVARAIAPNSKGPAGNKQSGGNMKKKFTGKGKKLGRK